MFRFLKIKQKGSVLLMALLIVTAILSAALSLGMVIISSIQRVRLTGQAFKAYYMAESGIEKALYEIRKERVEPDFIDDTSCDFSGFNCTRNVSYETSAAYNTLKKNHSVQLNLLNPSGSISAGMESLKITGYDANPSTYPLWLEITLTPIISGWNLGNTTKQLRACNSCVGSDDEIIIDLSSSNSYILRVKALYDDAKDISIAGYSGNNASGSQVSIGGKILIDSQGEYKNSRQKISVQLPAYPITLGYFDYVLFSEQDLDKEQPAPPPPPPPPNNNNNGG